MKRFFLIAAVFSAMLSAEAAAWNPPKVSLYRLPNGLRLYLLEDHSLPIVEARLFIKAGDLYDPPKMAGLSDILAALLATGGTESMKPEEMDAWLDARAIQLSADAGREITTVRISALSKVWPESLAFLGDLLLRPGWDPNRFSLAVHRYKESLRRDEDQPAVIAIRAFRKAVYGGESPLARVPTARSLDRITVTDVQKTFQKYFQPDRMMLAVAGDFSSARVKRWARKTLGSLKPSSDVQDLAWEDIPFENKPVRKRIRKKLTQTFIEAGHLALKRFDDEEYAYGLLQYILGGEPFISRLGSDIRTDRGLAYSVYSDWDTNPSRGLFRIHVETKVKTEDLVLERIKAHLADLAAAGNVTSEELNLAKEATLNKYIFWFDSPFKVAPQKANLDLLGFPAGYLEQYPKKIKKVTLKEVNAVAKKWLEPENLSVILVGP